MLDQGAPPRRATKQQQLRYVEHLHRQPSAVSSPRRQAPRVRRGRGVARRRGRQARCCHRSRPPVAASPTTRGSNTSAGGRRARSRVGTGNTGKRRTNDAREGQHDDDGGESFESASRWGRVESPRIGGLKRSRGACRAHRSGPLRPTTDRPKGAAQRRRCVGVCCDFASSFLRRGARAAVKTGLVRFQQPLMPGAPGALEAPVPRRWHRFTPAAQGGPGRHRRARR